MGHPHDGWCCSGEVRLGQRFVGRHSLHIKKRWLLENRLTVVARSPAAPSVTSLIALGAGS